MVVDFFGCGYNCLHGFKLFGCGFFGAMVGVFYHTFKQGLWFFTGVAVVGGLDVILGRVVFLACNRRS